MFLALRQEAEGEDPELGAAAGDEEPRGEPHARRGAETPAAAQDW